MKINKTDSHPEKSEAEVIYAPVEEIRNIERVIDNLEIVRRELLKVAEGMKEIIN